jgi:type II secretory pathway component PulC
MTDAAYAANRIRLMSPVAFDQRHLPRIAWLIVLMTIACGIYLYRLGATIPGVYPETHIAESKSSALEWASPAALRDQDWTIFRGPGAQPEAIEDELIRRFRLAGTFFEFTPRGSRKRLAIVEDRDLDKQLILREREKLDDSMIIHILRDHVVLMTQTGEEVRLSKSFTSGQAHAGEDEIAFTSDDGRASNSRFGAQSVGRNSWVFKRDKLIEYYRGLLDEPERLVLVFDSLKPVYTSDGWIEGYKLGVEGEGDFFEAIGLKEGDIVRRVNEVDMTNRKRAEFFIKQFVANEATAFALDVEREGFTEKLTYAVR